MFDLILRNGSVIDGTRRPRLKADVGIVGTEITAVGDLTGASTARSVDAQGQIVAPGFIDVHNHSDGWLLRERAFLPKLQQGYTT